MDDAKLYSNTGVYSVGFNFEIPVVHRFWIISGYFSFIVLDGVVGATFYLSGNIGFEGEKIN